MMRLLSGAAISFWWLALAPAQAPDAHQVHWQRSLDDALAVARATGRPLFVAINMDGESASDRIVRENYRDPAFVALTRRCVCLGASLFRHNARDHDDEGRRIPCPRFGEVTCGEHVALEPVLFEQFLADGERVAPRHALVRPDGKKAFDLSLCFDLLDIDRALRAAVGDLAPVDLDAGVGGEGDWAGLARRRDHRGRARLEAALSRARDEAALSAALDAIAAHGDPGSVEALRLVAARLPELPLPLGERLGEVARALGAEPQFAAALRSAVQALGPVLGDPGADARQRAALHLLLASAAAPAADLRWFLLARCATGGCGAAGPHEHDCAAAARARGGPVDLRLLLQTANAVTRRGADLPHEGGPGDALPEAAALQEELLGLDAVDAALRDAAWHARFAKASLDLGRRGIETGASNAQLLLEDAARSWAEALAAEPEHHEWWIERARAAFFLMRFDQQVECGRRALQLAAGSETLPREQGLLDDPALRDARVVEALRWIGDGEARQIADREAAAALGGMIDALRAYGVVCASPFGHGKDWQSLASLCGVLGLHREQQAVALAGAMRYPADTGLRRSLNDSLWSCGRPDLAGALAEQIAAAHAPSADASWHCGYAWLLVAEDARRTERPRTAVRHYGRAGERFARAAEQNADYAANCRYWQAVARLGRALAECRAGERGAAAESLGAAVALHGGLAEVQDGLGYGVLDLVDKILEWRADGPSEVAPVALLDRLDEVAPEDPFWAVAVSDSALREALRADGRNPERRERPTIDAGGDAITMPMGLPTELGDAYLEASIVAGRRAAARAPSASDRLPLAQSLTIFAERQFERGRPEGVRDALAEAAPLLEVAPPAPDAPEPALRALCAQLRERLGPARPREREGR